MSVSENNKRIAKNTIFLYFRMILVMGISLYTVRAVLNILGEVDYGIYNVVGGVVTMLSFISSTLSTSSQRYFSLHLTNNNIVKLNQWFSSNLNLFCIIALLCIVIFETIGLWFVNTQLSIPQERMFAAKVVYQLSILSFCIGIIRVPYTALVVAHEKMSAFAYIGILEAVSKLAIVVFLYFSTIDNLILYGILQCGISFMITILYVVYCRKHFKESKYKWYWNIQEVKELASFSNWHLLGTLSNIVRGQGINILINMFFNPAVNAARAIAYQVEHAVTQLYSNFFVAVKPQMYKYYGLKDWNNLHNLIIRSTQMAFFLTAVLSVPVLFEIDILLSLWLVDIPEYTIPFAQLVLIMGIIDSTSGPMICPILATGKIKNFYLVTGLSYIITLPISYIALKCGCAPYDTATIALIISFITMFARMYFVDKQIYLSIKKYSIVILRLFIALLLVCLPLYFLTKYIEAGFVRLIVTFIISTILLLLTFYVIVISKQERHVINSGINNFITKLKNK